MPYMKVSLAQKLNEEKQKELVSALGEALETIPGKNRNMLITDIEDGKSLFVGSTRQEDFAFIDVRYYLKFEYHIKKAFTKAVFSAVNKVLGTPYEKMSLNITEFTSWGGFGDFKDEYYKE